MKNTCLASVVSVLAILSACGVAVGQETKPTLPTTITDAKKKLEQPAKEAEKALKDAKDAAAKAAAEKAGAQPAGGDDMMAAWAEANKTTKEHGEMLAQYTGNWETSNKMWPAPGAPAMESKGSVRMMPIMGGRFIQSEFKGEMMGQPFNGMGLDGYNTATKKYESVWVDSSTNAMMFFTGTKQADGTVQMTTTYTDPMSGQEKSARSVLTIKSKDQMVFEMFEKGTDGAEFKNFEMTYNRVPMVTPKTSTHETPAKQIDETMPKGK